jgi:archaea-specific DNA-binding protein
MEQPASETINEPKPGKKGEASPKPAAGIEDNSVFIGKKGVMGYVLAVVTCFNRGAPEVVIKARGQMISRAVEAEEIVRRRFLPDAKVKDVKLATEELISRDGKNSGVPSIEITLSRKG